MRAGRARRQGFGHVLAVNQQLVRILAARGGVAVDMDNAALRVTLDVIGRVGFGKDFGATASLSDRRANAAFDLMGAGARPARAQRLRPRPARRREPAVMRRPRRGHPALEQPAAQVPPVRAGAGPASRWARHSTPAGTHARARPPQGVRRGRRELAAFRGMMAALLAEVRARGEPDPSDVTIAAHLLRIRDPATGRALPDDRLAAEAGVFFTGGFETTGHTIAWALLLISGHAAVEARVLAELGALRLPPRQAGRRPLGYDDLARLVYTGQAIKARAAAAAPARGAALRKG